MKWLRRWEPAPGLVLGEKSYSPGTVLGRHSHDHATLVLVLVGGFREQCDGETIERHPGELRIIPPDAPHTNVYGGNRTHCLLVELHSQWLTAGPSRATGLSRSTHHRIGAVASTLAQRMYQNLRIADDAAALTIEGLVLEILGESLRGTSARASTNPPAWLVRVRDQLSEDHIPSPRLAYLASQAGVHPAHLHRAFRAHFRCTPGQYLRALRISRARRALLDTQDAISQIALRAGFSDQAHLTRCFRDQVGMTPAQFRRSRHMLQ